MLDSLFDRLSNFLISYQPYFLSLSIVSALLLIVSLVATPYLVKKIPEDYFTNNYEKPKKSLLVRVFRNILGYILLIAGIIMLVAPGQGVLTILFGLFLMDFPRKKQLEKHIINNDKVFNVLNWLRAKSRCSDLKRD